MNEPLALLLAWTAGGLLGVFFFVGLWWTVRLAVTAKRPALLVFFSLPLRTMVVLAGFYAVSGHHLARLLLCLCGFLLARFVVARMTRPAQEALLHKNREASHAP